MSHLVPVQSSHYFWYEGNKYYLTHPFVNGYSSTVHRVKSVTNKAFDSSGLVFKMAKSFARNSGKTHPFALLKNEIAFLKTIPYGMARLPPTPLAKYFFKSSEGAFFGYLQRDLGVSLKRWLLDSPSDEDKNRVAKELVAGLLELFEIDALHLNIKMENLLINKSNNDIFVKYIGFSNAIRMKESMPTSFEERSKYLEAIDKVLLPFNQLNETEFNHLQILLRAMKENSNLDHSNLRVAVRALQTFSLGVTLFELYTSMELNPRTNQRIYDLDPESYHLRIGKLFESKCPAHICCLISKMTHPDLKKRVTFEELKAFVNNDENEYLFRANMTSAFLKEILDLCETNNPSLDFLNPEDIDFPELIEAKKYSKDNDEILAERVRPIQIFLAGARLYRLYTSTHPYLKVKADSYNDCVSKPTFETRSVYVYDLSSYDEQLQRTNLLRAGVDAHLAELIITMIHPDAKRRASWWNIHKYARRFL